MMPIDFSLRSAGIINEEGSETVTAPLSVIGLRMDIALTPNDSSEPDPSSSTWNTKISAGQFWNSLQRWNTTVEAFGNQAGI